MLITLISWHMQHLSTAVSDFSSFCELEHIQSYSLLFDHNSMHTQHKESSRVLRDLLQSLPLIWAKFRLQGKCLDQEYQRSHLIRKTHLPPQSLLEWYPRWVEFFSNSLLSTHMQSFPNKHRVFGSTHMDRFLKLYLLRNQAATKTHKWQFHRSNTAVLPLLSFHTV